MNILTNAWQTVVIIVVVLCLGIYIGTTFTQSCPPPTQNDSVPALQQG